MLFRSSLLFEVLENHMNSSGTPIFQLLNRETHMSVSFHPFLPPPDPTTAVKEAARQRGLVGAGPGDERRRERIGQGRLRQGWCGLHDGSVKRFPAPPPPRIPPRVDAGEASAVIGGGIVGEAHLLHERGHVVTQHA